MIACEQFSNIRRRGLGRSAQGIAAVDAGATHCEPDRAADHRQRRGRSRRRRRVWPWPLSTGLCFNILVTKEEVADSNRGWSVLLSSNLLHQVQFAVMSGDPRNSCAVPPAWEEQQRLLLTPASYAMLLSEKSEMLSIFYP